MPYIKPGLRPNIDAAVFKVIPFIQCEGDLNYAITRLVDTVLDLTGVNYKNLNGVVGVLECVKQELYRRVVAPYENMKAQENGDVYKTTEVVDG
jgi:hypothetical protein